MKLKPKYKRPSKQMKTNNRWFVKRKHLKQLNHQQKAKVTFSLPLKFIPYISIHLKTAKKKKTVTESDEENDEPSEDSDSDLPHPAHVDKSPRKIAQKPHEKSSRRKNIFESNSSDVDSIDEEEAFKPPPKLQQSKSQANKTSTKNKGTFEV